jgi:hypothetical protein
MLRLFVEMPTRNFKTVSPTENKIEIKAALNLMWDMSRSVVETSTFSRLSS